MDHNHYKLRTIYSRQQGQFSGSPPQQYSRLQVQVGIFRTFLLFRVSGYGKRLNAMLIHHLCVQLSDYCVFSNQE